jgi:hypothetical protein
MLPTKLSQSIIAVHRKHCIVAGILQHNLDDAARILLVVYDEDESHGGSSLKVAIPYTQHTPTNGSRKAAQHRVH